MSFTDDRPDLKFEVNFEDDPLQPHPAYLESTGPVGFWRMAALSGTTEEDQTANNRDLTYGNAPTLGATGAFYASYEDLNAAVEFNGSDEYALTSTSSAWQNLYAAWTLAAWIYPTATRQSNAQAWAGIINTEANYEAVVANPFVLHYGQNTTFAGISGSVVWAGFKNASNQTGFAKDTSAPTLNTWTHFAATYDGTTITLYRNGVSVATSTPGVANTAGASTLGLQVGWAGTGNTVTPGFPGRIDEPAVWDRALRADEVLNLVSYHTVATPDESNYIDLSASVDLNSYRVRSSPVRRGRSDSVSRVEAGTGTIVLGNRDGKLNPDPVVNLLVNPAASVADAGLPFTAQGAGTFTRYLSFAHTGTAMWWALPSSAATYYLTTERDGLVGMRPGKTYTFSGYMYLSSTNAPALSSVWLEIVDEVAGSAEVQAGSASIGAYDTFYRLTVTKTIRANADAAYIRVVFSNGSTKQLFFDSVQLEEGDTATTYCDGDQTDCSWGGEPHRSLSHRKQASAPARKIGMPMRRFRLTATWDGTDYGLLHGYVERWDWSFPSQGKDAYVTARLVDGTRVLAARSMRGFARSSERSGDRIRAILAHAGIGEDDIDVNDSYIDTTALRAQATVADDTSALALIRAVEETERGVFFVSKDGLFTYQGSLYRSIEGREDLIITDTTDDENQARYSDISISTDVAGLVNDENIENIQNGTDFRQQYTLSQQRYFPVAGSESSMWQTNSVSYFDRSVPLPYAEGIEVRPYRDPDNLWPAILGVELGALVRVERTHQGVDLAAGELHFLEGLEHDITPGNWVTRLRTAPTPRAPVTADPWQTTIAKPIYLTNVFSGSGGSSVVIPSRLYTAGKLYLLFCSLHATGGTAPVQPSFSGTNSWTSATAQTGVSSVSWRHQIFYTKATSTVTEAITLSFGGQTPNNLYDVVLVEISDGFNASPIGDVNGSTTVSAYAGYVDVGTLTNAQSIILAGVWKNANADTNWSGGVELYDRASFNNAYSVAYGFPPGVDRIDFSWGQANGFFGAGLEINA